MSGIVLDANDLLSKYGFDDGDVVCNWWDDRHPEDLADDSMHAALLALFVRFLMPKILARYPNFEFKFGGSIHNPIWATWIDDWVDRNTPKFDPPITVEIPELAIEQAIAEATA